MILLDSFFVQLAPWLSGDINNQQALTRLAQMYAYTTLENVGFATAADLGDPLSPFGSIHPRLKQPVGQRLARAARAITYSDPIPFLGPMAQSWGVVSQNTVQVTFEQTSVGGGMMAIPMSCDPNVPSNQCAEYEIGTANGWVPARGVISSMYSITVSASLGGQQITGVRYGYANYPIMTLHNKFGFPALPFMFPNPITPGEGHQNTIVQLNQ